MEPGDPEVLARWADDALAVATAQGVAYADVRALADETESIRVRDEQVLGVARATSTGLGVRVLVEGSWGFAATSLTGGPGDGEAVRRAAVHAVEVARASRRIPGAARVELDDTPAAVGAWTTPHDRDPLEVPLAEKVQHLLTVVGEARQVAGVSFVDASTDGFRRRTAFRSSAAARVDQTVIQVGGGFAVHAIGGGEAQRRSFPNSFGGQYVSGGWESVVALALHDAARRTALEAVALLDAPDLPLRPDAVVLLESSQLALQVHESIGHALELDRIQGMEAAYAGTSFVRESDLGSLRYGSDLVTVTADATTPGAMGTFGYDDEGVPARSTTLIDRGVLAGFLTNRETAATRGERSNGTARADSWGTIPLIRMNNVHLQPGPEPAVTLAELVADTDDGFLLLTNRSWSIDDQRDDFSFGCEAAYEVRHGRLGRLFRNPTYAGRTTRFWGSCDALGGTDDWRVWGVPNCGKGQPPQVARVAHGAPSGRFRATVGVR
ncbi:MAG: TldD/PmbA family protein [Actinomycetota bacterium]|nr:TldD/PmbA family protein [Actinomycetota bacterium]